MLRGQRAIFVCLYTPIVTFWGYVCIPTCDITGYISYKWYIVQVLESNLYCVVCCNQMAAITSQWWRRMANAYEVKAGMVCLQWCKNCVIHT